MKLYRYVRSYDWEGGGAIELIEYIVEKETSKTWTIIENGKQHIIRKEEGRKRFAYSKKEDAFRNFKKRTEKALAINQVNVDAAKHFLEEIKKMEGIALPITKTPEEYQTF